MAKLDADVIVVGGGNAAFSAALAAQEQGASVLMLEAAPENPAATAGSPRVRSGSFTTASTTSRHWCLT